MTDIEQKALALLRECAEVPAYVNLQAIPGFVRAALFRAIEQHEALEAENERLREAWKNYAPDGDWWLTDEREPADSCDYSVPLYAHPPAAPTDALVEKSREWAIVVREADKQWSQPLSTLLEQLAAALAAMQEAKP